MAGKLAQGISQRPLDQPPGEREGYRRILERFLDYCRPKNCLPSAARAREYVEVARLEYAPVPVQLQEWKDSLNWFFRQRKEWERSSVHGLPPLGRHDLGKADWERRLIERVRTLHLAWRTEQIYRDWISGGWLSSWKPSQWNRSLTTMSGAF